MATRNPQESTKPAVPRRTTRTPSRGTVAVTSEKTAASNTKSPGNGRTRSPSQEEIAVKAYELWETSGCEHGKDMEHWLEAERLLGGEEGTEPQRV